MVDVRHDAKIADVRWLDARNLFEQKALALCDRAQMSQRVGRHRRIGAMSQRDRRQATHNIISTLHLPELLAVHACLLCRRDHGSARGCCWTFAICAGARGMAVVEGVTAVGMRVCA